MTWDYYSSHAIKNGTHPLANAAAIWNGVDNHARHGIRNGIAAYSFHNFCETAFELRHKYRTYAHPDFRTWILACGDIHINDLDLMVGFAKNLPLSANPASQGIRHKEGHDSYIGPTPIDFLNEDITVENGMLKPCLMIKDKNRLYCSKYTDGDPLSDSNCW
jgi:hypothetical protein